ncbi:hypothetical protein SKAU_G00221900 [Synaphobranchus kaupii]|uniref:Uncharacterized protein n=1 Tax=Synaphobranchus kaupii TaxID=118154 RepID=A0A9Q1FAY8_SYNKA|nr:hypothetical protein SKAU_G00221900 [Synaphobranchus kaupii]
MIHQRTVYYVSTHTGLDSPLVFSEEMNEVVLKLRFCDDAALQDEYTSTAAFLTMFVTDTLCNDSGMKGDCMLSELK